MRKVLFFLVLAVSCGASEFVIPEFNHQFVNDYASILKPEEAIKLKQKLEEFQKATNNSMVIVTVPNLNGTSVEDFTIRLAEKWKVGKKGADNGLVYLIAPNERKARLEVGYGLEGKLPDGKCGSIIDVAVSHYKQKAYYNGVNAVLDGVFATFNFKSTVVPPAEPLVSDISIVITTIIIIILLILCGIFCPELLGVILQAIFEGSKRGGGSSSSGSSSGGSFGGGGASSSW